MNWGVGDWLMIIAVVSFAVGVISYSLGEANGRKKESEHLMRGSK